MKLSQKQMIFTFMRAKFVIWCFKHGYNLTTGEVYRPFAMQLLYFFGFDVRKKGDTIELVKGRKKSWTLSGKHPQKLAVDFNLFINGVYITDKEKFRPLGEKWEKMTKQFGGKWGGRFNIKPEDYKTKVGKDANHFQM